MSKIVPIVLSVFLVLTLSACREEEQDRILMYKKGIYLGQPDTELTSNEVNGLANQTRLQGSW